MVPSCLYRDQNETITDCIWQTNATDTVQTSWRDGCIIHVCVKQMKYKHNQWALEALVCVVFNFGCRARQTVLMLTMSWRQLPTYWHEIDIHHRHLTQRNNNNNKSISQNVELFFKDGKDLTCDLLICICNTYIIHCCHFGFVKKKQFSVGEPDLSPVLLCHLMALQQGQLLFGIFRVSTVIACLIFS